MITTLLIIIAIVQVYSFYKSFSKPNKKQHFENKLAGVQRMIYDLEFKIFKTKEIREGVRAEYDQMMARIDALDTQLKNPSLSKEDKGAIEDNKVRVERDVQRLKNQIASLDVEIHGQRQTNETPDGIAGIEDEIGALRELQGMLKDWIAKL